MQLTTDNIRLMHHASVRITSEKEKVIYVDPYNIDEELHDADIIMVTHPHYDHFSSADIQKIENEDTTYIFPYAMKEEVKNAGIGETRSYFMKTMEKIDCKDIIIKTVPAYNLAKDYHRKEYEWVGYNFCIDDIWYYVCGDMDYMENGVVAKCDIALVPIGGTYTFDAREAAKMINDMNVKIAIPTHYGSVVGKKEDEEEFKKYVNSDTQVVIKMEKY